MVRARELLSKFYVDAQEARPHEVDDMNIDAVEFNADKYVSAMLQNKSLDELVQRGNAMVSEIKNLDSDMQMLVYENYNKFIAATDTIRQMKHRVEDMESQMSQLETNMNTIATKSDAVNSSLSARRGQLEKLNGAKKTLTKLQFITDLPSLLEQCVLDEKYEQAVQYYKRAKRILSAVGTVASFQGIRDEADLLMRRLVQLLNLKLQEPDLPVEALGTTTRLLLQLDANEEAILKDFLARRRRVLLEVLNNFPPPPISREDASRPDEGEGEAAEPELDADSPNEPPSAAGDVRALGSLFMPQVVQLQEMWNSLFMSDAEPTVMGGGGARLSAERKAAMVSELIVELTGGYIELCRQRLLEELPPPPELLRGLYHLMHPIEPLHALLPAAALLPRAARVAEALGEAEMERQLRTLGEQVAAAVLGLTDGSGAVGKRLASVEAAICAHTQEALLRTAPLLLPLCELLGLRPDGMAKHLVKRLYAAILDVARVARLPTPQPEGMLLRAGLCLQMVSSGVAQVHAMLKAQLSGQGLRGAALGFDAAAMVREMQSSADALLEGFAQKLSWGVSKQMQTTDWVHAPAPREVTSLVGAIIGELRATQLLASQILHGEALRSLLPQGPFPPTSGATQILQQRAKLGGSVAIHKDLQRMFARKISFSSTSGHHKITIAGMLTHIIKLTLKTLLEESRVCTFSREGFQQLHLDCGMMRWVLPACVEQEADVLSLLDEILISCQERCLDCVPLEHAVLQRLCDAKRKELQLSYS
ncbi:hypothetical protein AB1Y20_016663 [Prymnesium parvum]|uniref:Vacuolar protein sorting-associated protein 51 homolog n=1 Tax=Prymnesium parvum TaxID=97485 RepID=A0AB34IBC8_PRYPA